ncbi:MAG: DMT family transporter [Halarsenatibacteraceae bacterium]
MTLSKDKKGILVTALSATGFGAMPVIAQVAYSYGSNVTTLLFLRFAIASFIFLLILKLSNITYNISKEDTIRLIFLGAAGYGLLSSLYFFGISLIPASLSGFLLYSYPAIVTILAFLGKEESLYRENFISLIVAIIGLAMILGPVFTSINLLGVGSILAAAFAYAIYILASNRVLKRVNWLSGSTVVTISAAFFFLVTGSFRGNLHLSKISLEIMLSGIGLAVFSTIIAVAGFYLGISLIGPSRASIVSSVEPLVTVILSALFFAERLTFTQFFGGLLIILSIIILNKFKNYRQKTFDKPV